MIGSYSARALSPALPDLVGRIWGELEPPDDGPMISPSSPSSLSPGRSLGRGVGLGEGEAHLRAAGTYEGGEADAVGDASKALTAASKSLAAVPMAVLEESGQALMGRVFEMVDGAETELLRALQAEDADGTGLVGPDALGRALALVGVALKKVELRKLLGQIDREKRGMAAIKDLLRLLLTEKTKRARLSGEEEAICVTEGILQGRLSVHTHPSLYDTPSV